MTDKRSRNSRRCPADSASARSSSPREQLTVGKIAHALRCHEQTARHYLHQVNANIDRHASNLAEVIDRSTLVALCRQQGDSINTRRLAPLLVPVRRR
ncbi:MAG: hypothetical protein KDD78_08510 [Caldilineaceae bacterium]|nr:hypothetical protein [Caldilineaceae bacterium]